MIGRRGLLGGIAAMVTSGDRGGRRPDQRLLGTSRSGTGPAPQTDEFIGRLAIIYGTGANTGLFVYNGTPALGNPPILAVTTASSDPYGNVVTPSAITDTAMPFLMYSGPPAAGNLIASWSPSLLATADEFGNVIPPGFTAFASLIPSAQLQAGKLQFFTSTSPSLNPSVSSTAAGAQADLVLTSGIGSGGLTAATMTLIDNTFAGGPLIKTGNTPVAVPLLDTLISGAIETWHTINPLSNGWGGSIRYRLRAENEVSLQADVITPGTLTSGTTLATLPAGYQPASEQRFPYSSGGTITAPFEMYGLLVTTGGAIQLAGGPTGLTSMSFNARIPLD